MKHRPHPARRARLAAAAVSAGAFLAITGVLVAQDQLTVTGGSAATSSTGSSSTSASTGTVSVSSSDDDWSATAGTTATDTTQADTSSHAS